MKHDRWLTPPPALLVNNVQSSVTVDPLVGSTILFTGRCCTEYFGTKIHYADGADSGIYSSFTNAQTDWL